MALVKQGTFRLVGVVDVQAVIEELASSEPEDIEAFTIAVVGSFGDRELAEQIAASLRAIQWVEVEAEPDDGLQANLEGDKCD